MGPLPSSGSHGWSRELAPLHPCGPYASVPPHSAAGASLLPKQLGGGGQMLLCSFPDDDVIGHILSHLPGPARTRKQVVKQLVQLGLAHSARDFPPPR